VLIDNRAVPVFKYPPKAGPTKWSVVLETTRCPQQEEEQPVVSSTGGGVSGERYSLTRAAARHTVGGLPRTQMKQ
jgi:hypothetical protein